MLPPTSEPWRYGRSEVSGLETLHRSLAATFPEVVHCWPFAPYVGKRFHEGPRLVFYGKATGGWCVETPLPARLTSDLLNNAADDCVSRSLSELPRSRFWRFLNEATEAVLKSLEFPGGNDWTDRHPFIAWSNYLKVGQDSAAAPERALYEAQRFKAEAWMRAELEHWRPRVVVTVTHLHYGETTAAIFGEDALWQRRPLKDLWVRDAAMPGGGMARVFWSCHPGRISNARRQGIVGAIADDLAHHPCP